MILTYQNKKIIHMLLTYILLTFSRYYMDPVAAATQLSTQPQPVAKPVAVAAKPQARAPQPIGKALTPPAVVSFFNSFFFLIQIFYGG